MRISLVAVVLILCIAEARAVLEQGDVTAAQRGAAGAASVDITPFPGAPTGGHGPAGAVARGYWGSLRASALFVQDPLGRALVLVSCDMFAVPTALHQAVAEHFTAGNPRNRTGVVLPLERIVIAATHTHQGPGNYLSAKVHNAHGSKVAGYDPALRDMLRTGVIDAIEAAIEDARGHSEFSLDITTGTFDRTLLRNRSPAVFMRDAESSGILASLGAGIPSSATWCQSERQEREPKRDWAIEGCPRLRAVDRNVTLLRLRRGARTRALGVFVGVHPTVLPASTELFSPDVFGIARARLQASLGGDTVVAFFNGTEADVTMRRTERNAVDVVTLGRSLGRQIQQVHDTATFRNIPLTAEGRLRFARGGDEIADPSGRRLRLAREAVAGVATLGGAEDDWTSLHTLRLAKPQTRAPRGDQGVKVPALGPFRHFLARKEDFPQALPLMLLRIGTLTLAVVPTEVSTAAGWQIRRAIGLPHGALEIVSMANEYGSYLSTADEYRAQDYMGASTLWGPEESLFFAEALRRLTLASAPVEGHPGDDRPGPEKRFDARRVGGAKRRLDSGYERLLSAEGWASRQLPYFRWCEEGDGSTAGTGRRVEVVTDDRSVGEAEGLVVVLDGAPVRGRARWGVIWATPLWDSTSGVFRFRITRGTQTIESEPFHVGGPSPPPACT